ncbi:MAG: PGPGW domain-containing protein [Candidatus Saccharimonadales bacterium]
MKSVREKAKTILIDIAGVFLIILSGLTGWLPGPGGIPLLIAGLGLLSINHDWAQRWLEFIKEHGLKVTDKLFNGSRKTAIFVDVIGIVVLSIAVIIVFIFTQNIAKSAAIWLVIVATVLLLGNRGRFKKITRKR